MHQNGTRSEERRAQALHIMVPVWLPLRLLGCHRIFLAAIVSASLPLQTFEEADIAKDGRISKEEWIILCKNQPAIISFMTLPLLKNDLTKKYSSFIFNV